MEQLKKYIRYTFYDENNNLIAIIKEDTPKEVMQDLQKEYDIIKRNED
jgi:hypothetical protein